MNQKINMGSMSEVYGLIKMIEKILARIFKPNISIIIQYPILFAQNYQYV